MKRSGVPTCYDKHMYLLRPYCETLTLTVSVLQLQCFDVLIVSDCFTTGPTCISTLTPSWTCWRSNNNCRMRYCGRVNCADTSTTILLRNNIPIDPATRGSKVIKRNYKLVLDSSSSSSSSSIRSMELQQVHVATST